MKTINYLLVIILLASACQSKKNDVEKRDMNEIKQKVEEFAPFKLKTDLSVLSEKEKQMLPLLFQTAKIMDDLFWKEAYGNKEALLASLKDEDEKAFAIINYGPWERLNANKPFVEGVGEKPKGAGFYPQDMTENEFEKLEGEEKRSLYTLVRRNDEGELSVVPYHVAFAKEVKHASELLQQASELAEDPGLKKYLELRAEALLNDDYLASDMAWMDMKTNTIDFVVGPIENYEDHLYGYKAAHEAYILIKDKVWSKKLEKFSSMLPDLQKALPCDPKYKTEMPGSNSDLNAYDVIFYAGDCNAGSKTIAINLPNDERVQMAKGSRRLQLKNAMRAKFDKILVPIAELLIDPSQKDFVKFDAFFENTMFHEVAHGLGPKMTVVDKITCREALRNHYSAIEENKADILGLWIVKQLGDMGELEEQDMRQNYVTFMAGLFRSIRFGAASAHGKANMLRFNYFEKEGAFVRDAASGKYRVDFDKMEKAMSSLSELMLTIEGEGDFEKASKLIESMGNVSEQLQGDLDRIKGAGIPRDIVFEQGPEILGL